MVTVNFKRFRMHYNLMKAIPESPPTPAGYRYISFRPELLPYHAEAKYLSFRHELDANLFPCLGQRGGCESLMQEIANRRGFVPAATWLVVHTDADNQQSYCGTVQGIRDQSGIGSIQNLGVVNGHRNQGLARGLLVRALTGFQEQGLATASLEVTAKNEEAVRLYTQFGFTLAETVYKSIEVEPIS